MLAQVGYLYGWPWFWVILVAGLAVITIVLYFFYRSQPPPDDL